MSSDIKKINIKKQEGFNITSGSIENLEQIVHLNYEIFKGMYEDEPYSLEQYKEKLKDKEPIIFILKKAMRLLVIQYHLKEKNHFIFGYWALRKRIEIKA